MISSGRWCINEQLVRTANFVDGSDKLKDVIPCAWLHIEWLDNSQALNIHGRDARWLFHALGGNPGAAGDFMDLELDRRATP